MSDVEDLAMRMDHEHTAGEDVVRALRVALAKVSHWNANHVPRDRHIGIIKGLQHELNKARRWNNVLHNQNRDLKAENKRLRAEVKSGSAAKVRQILAAKLKELDDE